MEKEKKPEQAKQQREIFGIDRDCKNEAISVHKPSLNAAPVSLCHLLAPLRINVSAVSHTTEIIWKSLQLYQVASFSFEKPTGMSVQNAIKC